MNPATATGISGLAGGAASPTVGKEQQLGQAEFLRLLTTQLRFQDPTAPVESEQFLTQMAQFSTVSGVQELATSFQSFASGAQSSQILQAAALVNREALTPAREIFIDDAGGARGAVELPQAAQGVAVTITDGLGQVVRTLQLGPHAAGIVNFSWDGLDDDGAVVSPGRYQIDALALGQAGSEAVPTSLWDKVVGVSLDADHGLRVHMQRLAPTTLDQLAQLS